MTHISMLDDHYVNRAPLGCDGSTAQNVLVAGTQPESQEVKGPIKMDMIAEV
jgi:hypothetical protein